VKVDIKRKNTADLISYEITRDKIPQYSINASYMVDREIGYIKVTRFAATTFDEFKKSIADLQAKGMKKLIIDLQGNPGGYMGAAINMADELLGDRDLIVSQKGKVSQYSQKAFAFRPGMFEEGSVIVLINEGSASASEILAGAIQDNDRGLIVGRRSFGKGLVQMPIDLSDGAELRLTIARYFTPSGRSIQKPYDSNYEAYERDWVDRYEHGEFFSADSIKFNDSLKYATKKGRTVYGGGGIMPDYFVPLDTTTNSAYVTKLFNSDSSREFILDYTSKNKGKFSKSNIEDYYATFRVSDQMLNELVEYGKKNKVDFDAKDFNKSKEYLRILIKAHLGRQLFDDNAFYKVINDINEVYQQAINLFDEADKIAISRDLKPVGEE
jgi:carboxyl-terminal processing protease